MKRKCPTCKKKFELPSKKGAEKPKFFPFCSERCKLLDLGAWFDAKYRISSTPAEHEKNPDSDLA